MELPVSNVQLSDCQQNWDAIKQRVFPPKAYAAFAVTGSMSSSGTAGVFNLMNFSTVSYDSHNCFDLTTDLFTCPINGIYHFDWTTEITTPLPAASAYHKSGLSENGVAAFTYTGQYSDQGTPTGLIENSTGSIDVKAVKGTTYSVRYLIGQTAVFTVIARFSGHLVGTI